MTNGNAKGGASSEPVAGPSRLRDTPNGLGWWAGSRESSQRKVSVEGLFWNQ